MIIQIIGWFALVCFIINFVGSYMLFCQGNVEGSRWAGIDSTLLLGVAAICFK